MTPAKVSSSLVGVGIGGCKKLLPGTTGRSFFMDPAVRDLLPPYPKEASNLKRKVNLKHSGNLPGDDLSTLFDHAMELRIRSGPKSTAPGRPLSGQFHLAILSCNKKGQRSLRGGGSRD